MGKSALQTALDTAREYRERATALQQELEEALTRQMHAEADAILSKRELAEAIEGAGNFWAVLARAEASEAREKQVRAETIEECAKVADEHAAKAKRQLERANKRVRFADVLEAVGHQGDPHGDRDALQVDMEAAEDIAREIRTAKAGSNTKEEPQ